MDAGRPTLTQRIPGLHRLLNLPRQLLRRSPFSGEIRPGRVPLFRPWSGRPSVPFPHPGNYQEPIVILETFFFEIDQRGPGTPAPDDSSRHNRYLDVPGCAPVFVTRDPAVIRAITTDTGDQPGQFDRDTLPSTGIARATGPDTLLFANGGTWRRQRKLAASPFGKTTLFQPELFQEFEQTFRETVSRRLDALRQHLQATGQGEVTLSLEPEVKAVMLEMLANNFFGAEIPYDELRNVFVPALERVIDHIVRDTVSHKLRYLIGWWPSVRRRRVQVAADQAQFDRLTDLVLAARRHNAGLWRQFKSDAPDEALRANLKVFLAGALEATTSFATWAISHLARHPQVQERLYQEVRDVENYSPDNLGAARYLGYVLEETLRLTPALYFLPRRATADTTIQTADGRTLTIPRGTHILLDVWHANRHEDFWGVAATGFSADQFVPERWEDLAARGKASKDALHFGFGHGPRVCPGKHLGQLEVALVVGAFVKLFQCAALSPENPARAGVSTKPADGTQVKLRLR